MISNVPLSISLQMQMEAKKHHHESVSKLEYKVKDLERKCEEQSSNFSRLSYELSSLRQEASTHLRTISTISSPQDGPKGVSANGNSTEPWNRMTEDDAVARGVALETRRPVPSGAEQIVHTSELPRGRFGRKMWV